jgi:hypothetical protein
LKEKKINHLRNSFLCLVLFLILCILMYTKFTYLVDVTFWWMFILPIFGIIEAVLGKGKKKWLFLFLNIVSLVVVLAILL